MPAGSTSVWAQYTIRVAGGRRDKLAAALKAEGIPTAIYYPIPLHRQQAYKHYPVGEGGVAVSDRLAAEVISLPMHAYLDAADAGPHHRRRAPRTSVVNDLEANFSVRLAKLKYQFLPQTIEMQ